jgi:hypothetical protein
VSSQLFGISTSSVGNCIHDLVGYPRVCSLHP